ncbi:MAG: hypothetical protein ACI9H6_000230 [Patiriisocius sp.]|jgi:hypothetical protein
MLYEKIQLEENERIIETVHKHWFLFFSHGFGILVVSLIPLIAWIILSIVSQDSIGGITIDLSLYTSYFVFFYSFWLMINWMTLAHMWTTDHLDIWVITDRRLILIEQISLFKRQIGSFRLEKLQDVNIEVNGIVATFLGFGTVEAQTASGSETEFRTKHLPNPRELKSVILKAADERMNTQNNINRNGE